MKQLNILKVTSVIAFFCILLGLISNLVVWGEEIHFLMPTIGALLYWLYTLAPPAVLALFFTKYYDTENSRYFIPAVFGILTVTGLVDVIGYLTVADGSLSMLDYVMTFVGIALFALATFTSYKGIGSMKFVMLASAFRLIIEAIAFFAMFGGASYWFSGTGPIMTFLFMEILEVGMVLFFGSILMYAWNKGTKKNDLEV